MSACFMFHVPEKREEKRREDQGSEERVVFFILHSSVEVKVNCECRELYFSEEGKQQVEVSRKQIISNCDYSFCTAISISKELPFNEAIQLLLNLKQK
jgi:hypothetical protein